MKSKTHERCSESTQGLPDTKSLSALNAREMLEVTRW